MNRLLVFHQHGHVPNNTRLSPSAYYIEADYTKVAVRIYAGTAPDTDAKFDIFDDGVSIFAEQGSESLNKVTGVISTIGSGTSITLRQNSEEAAEVFNDNLIEEGSWVHCEVVDTGAGKDFTVILELEPDE